MTTLEGRYDFKTAEPRLQAQWADERHLRVRSGRPGPTYTGGYAAAHGVGPDPHRPRLLLHPGGRDGPLPPHARASRCSIPSASTTTACPPSASPRTAGASAPARSAVAAFIGACLALSEEVEATFERFWKRLGLSVDWRLRYSTIDPRSRRVSQAGVSRPLREGSGLSPGGAHPVVPGVPHGGGPGRHGRQAGRGHAVLTIPFTLDDGRELRIATTRPELLPACVAVFVHPDDPRYTASIGRQATTPLFDLAVPVLADDEVDREKGTGAVMCCTFGDVTDVYWWRTYNLPLRIVIDPGRPDERAGRPLRWTAHQGRRGQRSWRIWLRRARSWRAGAIEHTRGRPRALRHGDRVPGGRPVVHPRAGEQGAVPGGGAAASPGIPSTCAPATRAGLRGLNWDWNISRQRYYGVPFPVWYCQACGQPVMADRAQLPVDPQETGPPAAACAACGGARLRPRDGCDGHLGHLVGDAADRAARCSTDWACVRRGV